MTTQPPAAREWDMSKHINVNPGQYTDAGREHQGEGIVHDSERAEDQQTKARTSHMPNQERASTLAPSGLEEEPDAADDARAPRLSDDQGLPD